MTAASSPEFHAVRENVSLVARPRQTALIPADTVAGRALVVVIAIMTFLACLTAGAAILVGEYIRLKLQ